MQKSTSSEIIETVAKFRAEMFAVELAMQAIIEANHGDPALMEAFRRKNTDLINLLCASEVPEDLIQLSIEKFSRFRSLAEVGRDPQD